MGYHIVRGDSVMKLFNKSDKPIGERICDAIQHWRNERYLNQKMTLIELTFDKEREEYTMEYLIRKRKELPKDAVHVTKKRKMYFVDYTEHEEIQRPDHPECTAVDLNLFLENNLISDAMQMAYTRKDQIDVKKALMIIGIAIIGAIIFYTIRG